MSRYFHSSADSGLGDWASGRVLLDTWLARGAMRR